MLRPSIASTTDFRRDALIAEHAAAARRIAMKMARRCPEHLRDDVVAAGMLGLAEAAKRFDASRMEPEAFLGFAMRRIRGAILDELRRGDMLSRRVRQTARKVASAIRSIENSGETATDQRVADAMGVTVQYYREHLANLVHVEVVSVEHDGGAATTLVDHDTAAPDAQAERREALANVRVALGQLSKRDQTILSLRFIEELTVAEMGAVLRVSTSRASQLVQQAIERLRAQLGETAEEAAA